MARSTNLHGVLSTDHPFEYLGGLSAAIRHLDGTAPALYISDLRNNQPATTTLAHFLANELRVRALNPHWIEAMKAEGYAGTLEMLDTTNNLFGWQVVDPSTVRPDQWQAMFDTYVADMRDLGMDAYFETFNPTAQAQLMERMIEAIRKGYWDAPEAVRMQLASRWRELAAGHGVDVGEEPTTAFIEKMARGFGLAAPSAPAQTQDARGQESDIGASAPANTPQPVTGQVLEEVPQEIAPQDPWSHRLAIMAMLGLAVLGASLQWRANATRT